MADTARIVHDFAIRNCAENLAWLERGLAAANAPSSTGFRAAYASVQRRLGARALERSAPPSQLAELARPHWTLTDWVRLALTLAALQAAPFEQHGGIVLRLFEAGEIGEEESVLRTLSLLPEQARFVETGLQACRTNALSVFEAIACENAYPALHFPELNFNQMVLKAIFMEVSVQRIENLTSRITPELKRMAEGYASERRAAGRAVPLDTDYILRAGESG